MKKQLHKRKLPSKRRVARPVCGVVMPISGFDGYPASHWNAVRAILFDAIRRAGFSPRLVSSATEVGVIHKRIARNLYSDPFVVCDVSGRNANVMLELGMRLAFDKPVVIVKDDLTSYSFDTQPIEHLEYEAALDKKRVSTFKRTLRAKIIATHGVAQSDPEYSPFLGDFLDLPRAKSSEGAALLETISQRLDEALGKPKGRRAAPTRVASKGTLRAKAQAAAVPGISRIDQASSATHGYFVRVGYHRTQEGAWRPKHRAFFGDASHGGKEKAFRAALEWFKSQSRGTGGPRAV